MSDGVIFLEEFQYSCCIGCSEEERAFPQTISLDATLRTDFSQVLSKLDLTQGIDWAELDALFSRIVAQQKWTLAEELADSLCMHVLGAFPAAKSIRLRLRKSPFAHGKAVGVEIERER